MKSMLIASSCLVPEGTERKKYRLWSGEAGKKRKQHFQCNIHLPQRDPPTALPNPHPAPHHSTPNPAPPSSSSSTSLCQPACRRWTMGRRGAAASVWLPELMRISQRPVDSLSPSLVSSSLQLSPPLPLSNNHLSQRSFLSAPPPTHTNTLQ